MKKIFLIITVLGFSISLLKAQSTPALTTPATTPAIEKNAAPAPLEVPAAAKNKFAVDYPAIKDGKWEKYGNDVAVVFNDNGANSRVVYAPNGKLVLSAIGQRPTAALPGIKDYVTKNYPGKTISSLVHYTEMDKQWYEIKVGETSLTFDGAGNVVKVPELKSTPAGK